MRQQTFHTLSHGFAAEQVKVENEPIYRDFRAGDVRHSQADIAKARTKLGYEPEFNFFDGIDKAMPWYINFFK